MRLDLHCAICGEEVEFDEAREASVEAFICDNPDLAMANIQLACEKCYAAVSKEIKETGVEFSIPHIRLQ